jgi:hypothetical protein
VWEVFSRKRTNRGEASSSNKQINIQAPTSPLINFKDAVMAEPEFTLKRNVEIVLTIDQDQLKYFSDPWEVKRRYLDVNNFLVKSKNRMDYEAILIESKSIEIVHNTWNTTPNSPYTYSKCIIKQVHDRNVWGFDLNKPRRLRNGVEFNFWDYIEAWNYAFYYQNNARKHTWFFKLGQELCNKELPNWFLNNWWNFFGPEEDVFPKELKNWFIIWKKYCPSLKRFEEGKLPLGLDLYLFMAQYGFPWIMKWDLEVDYDISNLPVLNRIFSYRWWGKYTDFTDKFKEIEQDIKTYKLVDKERSKTNDPINIMKEKIKKEFPHLPDDLVLIKCMDAMRQSLFDSFEIKGDDVASSTSSSVEILAGESQPPEETLVADVWHSVTELLAENLKKKEGEKNKGKAEMEIDEFGNIKH